MTRLVVGLILWAALIGVAGYGVLAPDGPAREPAERVLRFLGESPLRVEAAFPAGTDVRVGDPVLLPDPVLYLAQIGHVERVSSTDDLVLATLLVHPEESDLLRVGAGAEAFTVPTSARWVAQTLLPKERLEEIRGMAQVFLLAHGTEIRNLLWPEVQKGIQDVVSHLERELPAALAAQSPRWEAFLLRHRDGVIRETLLPVLQETCLESAREKFDPLIRDVGGELWRALPIWSLGFKYVWQRVPFTEAGQMEARFQKYLRKDAAPILAAHADEAAKLAREVIQECIQKPELRDALAEALGTMSSDPELGAMTKDLVDVILLKNERLRDVVRARWQSGLGDAVAAAAAKLEPLIRRAVDSVILDESRKGINPRLSRVLRTRVLMKDGRWVLLAGGDGDRLPEGARIPGSVRDG